MDFDNLQSVNSSVSDTLPFEAISITGRDCFWDGSVPNPLVSVGSPTMSVSSIIPEPSGAGARVGGLAGPVPSRPRVGIPTLSTVTHTVSRPVNTTGSFSSAPGSSMGLNLPGSRPPVFSHGYCLPGPSIPPVQTWARPPWAVPTQSYPGSQGVNPFAYWPQPVHFSQDTFRTPVTCSQSNSSSVLQNSELVSSFKEVLSDFKKSMSDDLATISSRISSLEADHRVSLPTPGEEVSDLISMAPGSQEATFLSEDEHEEGDSSMARVSDKVPLAHRTKSITSTDVGSPRESEAEDSSVSSKDQLRARVYSLLREVAHVPLSSPPRLKKSNSFFETSCGLVQEKPNTFGSFPESNHASSALQLVNNSLSVKANDKSSQGSSFSGFGASSFPGNFKSKDFEIHDSSIGKTAPVCDKSFSQLLGAKPVDGLRLSQSLWAKSENLLRSASHVLGTAEFFLSAVGALLQGKEGEDLAEVKSLLLQVDQALGSSQCLLMGTLANFTLSKRREILEKSSVNEILQDSLLRSPLSDKVFGLSLQKVQEEVIKTPQPLRVNVQLTNGKRSASVSSSAPTGSDKRRKTFVPKASGPKKPHQKGGFKGAKKPGSRK